MGIWNRYKNKILKSVTKNKILCFIASHTPNRKELNKYISKPVLSIYSITSYVANKRLFNVCGVVCILLFTNSARVSPISARLIFFKIYFIEIIVDESI